jgi:hypothetical protein
MRPCRCSRLRLGARRLSDSHAAPPEASRRGHRRGARPYMCAPGDHHTIRFTKAAQFGTNIAPIATPNPLLCLMGMRWRAPATGVWLPHQCCVGVDAQPVGGAAKWQWWWRHAAKQTSCSCIRNGSVQCSPEVGQAYPRHLFPCNVLNGCVAWINTT